MFSAIYDKVIELGIIHDHHESDLYIPVNEQTKNLVKAFEYSTMVETFKSQIDGSFWYNIPFAYTPWWEERVKQNV